MKKAIVFGAGGFIGSHLVKRLKSEGYWVMGIDLKSPEFSETVADEFYELDLRSATNMAWILDPANPKCGPVDEIYQLAADMGGAGYIFSGENDANVMHNSALININTAYYASVYQKQAKIFYSSSACMYPQEIQMETNNNGLRETDAYPGNPDSEYGWEKLFSERLYLAFARNYKQDIRIARFHNIFGPESCYNNGKEKAPAAICRKVAQANDGESIEIWGDGLQTRSFLYIDECLDGILALMDSDCKAPVNIGSDEMISINDLALMVIKFSDKDITLTHVEGPVGVRGRNSDNTFVFEQLKWKPVLSLHEGMLKTYDWVNNQLS